MPDEPYRPAPPGLDRAGELSRLAAEGQHRIDEANAHQAAALQVTDQKSHDKNVRLALGEHYGAPVRTMSYVLIVAVVALLVVLALMGNALLLEMLWPLLPGTVLFRIFATPKATRARVAAERAWQAGLPFAVVGYFETLGAEPALSMRIEVDITWRGNEFGRAGGDPAVVQGILGLLDTGARILAHEGGKLRIRSGPISGRTPFQVQSRAGIYRVVTQNARIVPYVHRLVDEALLRLHRSYPIANVSIARG
ncbi:MAG: hypothetical protein ACRELB_22710 [Polyangiaceae bacterium]